MVMSCGATVRQVNTRLPGHRSHTRCLLGTADDNRELKHASAAGRTQVTWTVTIATAEQLMRDFHTYHESTTEVT